MSQLYAENLGQRTTETDEDKAKALRHAALDTVNSHVSDEQKMLWLLELSEIAESEGLDSTYIEFLYQQIDRSE